LFHLKEDLEGVAMVALCESAEKFDSTKGYKFSTFGVACIHQELLNFIRKETTYSGRVFPLELLSKDDGEGTSFSWEEFIQGSNLVNPKDIINKNIFDTPTREVAYLLLDGVTDREAKGKLGIQWDNFYELKRKVKESLKV